MRHENGRADTSRGRSGPEVEVELEEETSIWMLILVALCISLAVVVVCALFYRLASFYSALKNRRLKPEYRNARGLWKVCVYGTGNNWGKRESKGRTAGHMIEWADIRTRMQVCEEGEDEGEREKNVRARENVLVEMEFSAIQPNDI